MIYELHVKGFTQRHPDVPDALRGTYQGLASEAAIEHGPSSRAILRPAPYWSHRASVRGRERADGAPGGLMTAIQEWEARGEYRELAGERVFTLVAPARGPETAEPPIGVG